MKAIKASSKEPLPSWVDHCISYPQKGVMEFLQELCFIGHAPYAHIRVRSRSGKFYKMAESIGPYKLIGWQRRFQLIDKQQQDSLSYQFIDYQTSSDCKTMRDKFSPDSIEYQYLNSLLFGFWVPLIVNGIGLGYVTLSWDRGTKQIKDARNVQNYIRKYSAFIPLVYQAARNIIADRYLLSLWSDAAAILSARNEDDCYDRIADACLNLWGNDATIYIGKVADDKRHFELATVAGHQSSNIKKELFTKQIPINRGIFGYLRKNDGPVVSYSTARDERFRYHSMREDGEKEGSALAMKLSDPSDKNPIAFLSVEHERENYFDTDDTRYIIGLSRLGYENIMSHRLAAESRSRDFDALFTQVAHDVVEPLQALISEAAILKYEATNAPNYKGKPIEVSRFMEDTLLRTTSFLDEALDLHRLMWGHLDTSIDGSSTRIRAGKTRVFPMLNTLMDTWTPRAASSGIEIKRLYDSLREIKVAGDEAELKTIIDHLTGNAIKYSFWGRMQHEGDQKKPGRFISVIGRVRTDTLIIEFQNYGIGILSTEIQRVTEKYYRGKLAIREGKAGTGRGLWSVAKYLQEINGKLTIRSTPKSSDLYGPYFTVVSIQLPIAFSEEEQNG